MPARQLFPSPTSTSSLPFIHILFAYSFQPFSSLTSFPATPRSLTSSSGTSCPSISCSTNPSATSRNPLQFFSNPVQPYPAQPHPAHPHPVYPTPLSHILFIYPAMPALAAHKLRQAAPTRLIASLPRPGLYTAHAKIWQHIPPFRQRDALFVQCRQPPRRAAAPSSGSFQRGQFCH